MHMWCNVFIL